jgi:hypothetical protein
MQPRSGSAATPLPLRAPPCSTAPGTPPSPLQARGFQPYVLPLERKDWFNVARNLLTLGFWSGSLTTSPGYSWYLDRLAAVVARAMEETGAEQVGAAAWGWCRRRTEARPLSLLRTRVVQARRASAAAGCLADALCRHCSQVVGRADLCSVAAGHTFAPPAPAPLTRSGTPPQVDLVGHSAGGWLGRAFMADPKYMNGAGASWDGPPHNGVVRCLVTLGTPHMPPPPGSKARDMTGGGRRRVEGPGAPGHCRVLVLLHLPELWERGPLKRRARPRLQRRAQQVATHGSACTRSLAAPVELCSSSSNGPLAVHHCRGAHLGRPQLPR